MLRHVSLTPHKLEAGAEWRAAQAGKKAGALSN